MWLTWFSPQGTSPPPPLPPCTIPLYYWRAIAVSNWLRVIHRTLRSVKWHYEVWWSPPIFLTHFHFYIFVPHFRPPKWNLYTFWSHIFRCVASCIAVTTSIALMLQRQHCHVDSKGRFKINEIIKCSYRYAKQQLTNKKQVCNIVSTLHKSVFILSKALINFFTFSYFLDHQNWIW